MARETEIKLKIKNRKAFQRALERLGAKTGLPGSGRVHQMNLIFDTPQGGLAKHGQLLRIRTEIPPPKAGGRAKLGQRAILTFKSPPEELAIGGRSGPSPTGEPERPRRGPAPIGRSRHKVREEIELVLTDGAALERIFEGLGLRAWFRYEKYRTTYRLPSRMKWAQHLLIELDETPIGTFVELEGPGEAIDRAAKELGFSVRDYIVKNYLVLYLEDCRRRGEQPGDMLFGATD
jgi:adenylate cyclase, class 2